MTLFLVFSNPYAHIKAFPSERGFIIAKDCSHFPIFCNDYIHRLLYNISTIINYTVIKLNINPQIKIITQVFSFLNYKKLKLKYFKISKEIHRKLRKMYSSQGSENIYK